MSTDATPAGSPAATPDRNEPVVLVDPEDRELGLAPKLEAHARGLLHRAVSVVLVDRDGRLLLQKRAASKYHSPGLWSNTACTHPHPGETTGEAAHRRLRQEMGIDCPLEPAGTFVYRAEVGAGLVEHELDHLFTGRFDGEPAPDPGEVATWRWVGAADLARELAAAPERFSAWLPRVLERLA